MMDLLFAVRLGLFVGIMAGMSVFFMITLPIFKTEKQKAWLITLFSSTILSAIGMYKSLDLATVNIYLTRENLHSDNCLSVFGCIFFLNANMLDLLFGARYYPSETKLLSGYVHHIFYVGWISIVMYYNSSNGAVFFFVEEIPTLVMAIGSLFPALRSDWLFGITFFIFRIVYHTWYTYRMFSSDYESAYWRVALAVFMLHLFWMAQWCKGMIKRTKSAKNLMDIKDR